jgi:hypothetical protein
LFSMPLGEEREEWTVWLTREKLWERYRTLGQVAVLEGEELEVSVSLPFFHFLYAWMVVLICSLLSRKPARSSMRCSQVRTSRRMRRAKWLFTGLRMLSGRRRFRPRARMKCLQFRGRRNKRGWLGGTIEI